MVRWVAGIEAMFDAINSVMSRTNIQHKLERTTRTQTDPARGHHGRGTRRGDVRTDGAQRCVACAKVVWFDAEAHTRYVETHAMLTYTHKRIFYRRRQDHPVGCARGAQDDGRRGGAGTSLSTYICPCPPIHPLCVWDASSVGLSSCVIHSGPKNPNPTLQVAVTHHVKRSAYVTQDDIHLPTLTVRETLFFAALLRMEEEVKHPLHICLVR